MRCRVLAMVGIVDPPRKEARDAIALCKDAGIQVRNYDSGHMSYLDDRVRRLQKADLRAFYNSVSVAQ